ncbi:MAG TPA: Hsp20/alpha crystallin family protein [Nocardioidaceae bacterium]|nr:Hsp20/alpha crystallin family protein [Nocardioidaceae bacterium]
MTTVAKRSSSPMAEMLDWLESNAPLNLRGLGLAPYVRIEDFVEEDAYVLRAELPGLDPEKDVEVSIENDMLTIRGERREETKEKNRREFHYGSFRRTVSLPKGADADNITASYTDGVLEVRVPTTAEVAPSVRIPVQRSE